MKRIGLLGGMSWESSAEYYRLVNEEVRARLGGLHSADCVMRSLDFAPIEELQAAGEWDEAGALLAAASGSLVAAGAELLVLCTNTMHKRLRELHGLEVLVPDATDRALVLLIGPSDVELPLFDSTRRHARRAVEIALAPGRSDPVGLSPLDQTV